MLLATTAMVPHLQFKLIAIIAPDLHQQLQTQCTSQIFIDIASVPHTACLEFAASPTISQLTPAIQFHLSTAVFDLLLIFFKQYLLLHGYQHHQTTATNTDLSRSKILFVS